jgi:hypothetical protein
MLKGLFKVMVAGTSGFLSIIAAYHVLGLYKGPDVMSNGMLVALLAAPFAIGGLVGYAVHRLLDSMI